MASLLLIFNTINEMNRRLFLELLAMLPLLESCKNTPDEIIPEPTPKGKVIVIGAGAAGMYAAYLLDKEGIDVQILEASNVQGGRMRTLNGFADFPVELGAEEIHGKNSVWYNIVQQSGATFLNNNTTNYIEWDGKVQSEAALKNNTAYQAALKFVETTESYAGTDLSVQALAQKQNLPTQSQNLVNALIGNEYGTSNARLSAKGVGEMNKLWSSGEDNVMVADRSLLNSLERYCKVIIPKIAFNTPVTAIDYSASTIQISTKIGRTYEGVRVIVTVPLPILKAKSITFTPTLPTTKTEAINKIGMDAGMKVILKFKTRFWADDLGSLYTTTRRAPEYWFTSLGRGKDNVLTAFITGEKAAALSNAGKEATIKFLLEDLDALYAGKASQNMDTHYFMDWAKEPYILGAYSYPALGGGIKHHQELAKSVHKRVFFAGEATHTAGHNATVHGALQSAEVAVKEIFTTFK
jgi:monoamine oxidase